MMPEENFRQLREHYLEQPNEISIETLALCNAACTFCPYPSLERKGTRMTDELLAKLVDEMAGFDVPFTVSPFKVNEPLLDKRLIPLCRELNERCPNAYLRIFTNGAALTRQKAEEIAGLERIRHLWVSLNETDPAKYETLMGMPFERTAKRLDDLHSWDFPHQVVLSAVGAGKAFRYYCYWRWPKFTAFVIKRDSWLGFTEPDESAVPDTPCTRWFELSIMASGTVSHCCMDGSGRWPIGDVNGSTMLEVYNAPYWRERRELMLSRLALGTDSPCAQCSY